MNKIFYLILLLFLVMVFSSCASTSTDTKSKGDANQQQHSGTNTDAFIHAGDQGTLIIKKSHRFPHDPDLDGIYKQQGSFNGKKYYKHQSRGYYIFWDTGKDHGATESEQHTGGQQQWDLSKRLGGDEIIYSISENILGQWSDDGGESDENEIYEARTGVVKKGPKESVVLASSGKIDIPHDASLDGIYKEAGNFNSKTYYRHENRKLYIFWDTGKDYGATESDQHTGGHQQWDLSDRLGGDEIIYSASVNVLGDWSAESEQDSENKNYANKTGVVKNGPKTSAFRITLILDSNGEINIPHDPAIDGIYQEAGTFNGKSYFKHQNKNYFIFWDTGRDYAETESEQHTGGHQQWDLSDRLGGIEIIYSASENVLGDWFAEKVDDAAISEEKRR